MPTIQTGHGCINAPRRPRAAASTSPQPPPIAKVSAASSNGGAAPEAAVSKASADQSRMARQPISVAAREFGVETREVSVIERLLAAARPDGKPELRALSPQSRIL